ncbi:cysteine--tRNA ligase [Verrucomicrobia bacterium LW23]|nr:cysteine--tRNA ligase [Verrucomicrobia bacterium LW23]
MRPLRLYNSFTRTIEDFQPLEAPHVRMYACGPTVYNFAHIGNFRAYIFTDLLQRVLRNFNYKVRFVMQRTDVDDKTIKGAQAEGIPLREFTARYAKAFLEDMAQLNIEPQDDMPNATDHIPQMTGLISQLVEKGNAYPSDDGSVYFRVSSFGPYGCLCGLDFDGLKAGARVSHDEYEKESFGDFVLWKKWVAADGDVAWDSPWGKGRPGWHIECSAMSMHYLGKEIDIHCGGVDLKFPHHENEIAQSEAATGKKFARYWLHNEHLLVDGRKMSKRDGTFFTVRDVLAKGYEGRVLRYALLANVQYRQNLNFTWQVMDAAKATVQRIDEWRKRFAGNPLADKPADEAGRGFIETFYNTLAEDLDMPGAIGHLHNYITETNKLMDSGHFPEGIGAVWTKINAILGLKEPELSIPNEVQDLLDQRGAARKAKDFKLSDELRKAIETHGFKVKDTAKGQELLRS